MELGLSLGDSHKFLENKMKNSGIKINGSSDLCMALSLNSWAVEETTQKSQENDESDEEDGNRYIYNFQLNLLPQNGSSPSGNSNCRSTKREFVNDDEEDGCHNRKKLRLSKQQSAFLEESFKQHNALNPKQKLGLAKQLNLIPRQVEVWFQNRRARTKLKQTEVEWEYLKRSCEKLSQENRKLQKELKELRFLNSTTNPPSYMQLLPPTTLTLCPSSCHRDAAAAPPTITKAFPVPLSRSRFYPFSQAANQPATS